MRDPAGCSLQAIRKHTTTLSTWIGPSMATTCLISSAIRRLGTSCIFGPSETCGASSRYALVPARVLSRSCRLISVTSTHSSLTTQVLLAGYYKGGLAAQVWPRP